MINEKQKWPSNKSKYDINYSRIFGNDCDICKGKGYHWDWDNTTKHFLKTTCIICKGTGRRI